jgi:hypothetical protein
LRSYDPQLGRFLQWDPYDQYASGYVGMGNDPVNMVDPTGGWGEKIWELTSQAVMTGSSGGVVVAPTAAQKAASAARKAAKIAEAAKNTKKLVNTAIAVADAVTDALPFVGSTKDIYRGARDGDWLQLGLGIVGLAADVFTLGGASVAKGAVKVGVKAALKSSTKKAVKETVEEGGQKLVNKTTRKLPCGCFVAGTLILTSSGQKPIEDIDVGDMVWAYNDTTDTYDQKRVKTLFRYERDSVYHIQVGNEVIKATADHPFFIGGRWLRVAELKVGDSAQLFDGSNLVIEQITVVPGRTTVYNFEVEDYHTYYVTNTKVLVHNSGPCDVVPGQKGGVGPNNTGKKFEADNGIEGRSGRETYRGQSGKDRIVDKSDDFEILETKANNSYVQHLSTQIKDAYQRALDTGRNFRLKLARPDKITKPLKELAEKSNGRFIIE